MASDDERVDDDLEDMTPPPLPDIEEPEILTREQRTTPRPREPETPPEEVQEAKEVEEITFLGPRPPPSIKLPTATDNLIKQRTKEQDAGPSGPELKSEVRYFGGGILPPLDGEDIEPPAEERAQPEQRSAAAQREASQRNAPFLPGSLQIAEVMGPAPQAAAVAPAATGGGGQAGNEQMIQLLQTINETLERLLTATEDNTTAVSELKDSLEGVGTFGP